MPDYVINRIEMKGDKTLIKQVRADISGGQTEYNNPIPIDFNKIVPPPTNMFTKELSPQQKIGLREQGTPNWLDWQSENWGTKWNAIKQVEESDSAFLFLTAWTPPFPICVKLSILYPNLEFELKWCDEFGFEDYYIGYAKFKNGKQDIVELNSDSSEAQELAEELIMKYANLG